MTTILKLCRCCSFKSVTLGAFYPFIRDGEDTVTETETSKKIQKEKAENECGRDRLYVMFSSDESGAISKELNSVYQATFFGGFLGFMYGGFVHSRLAYINFIERNKATSFQSHFEAKRMLQDQVTVNFAKGAFRWGWRIALFTGSYVLITTAVSVYRGKSSILEYSLAGGLTGGMYKVNMGLRGMLVGGVLGTCLGTIAGGCSLALLKLSGTTMEDMRYWQYEWKEARSQAWRMGYKQSRDTNTDADPLLQEREELLKVIKTTSASSNEVNKTTSASSNEVNKTTSASSNEVNKTTSASSNEVKAS